MKHRLITLLLFGFLTASAGGAISDAARESLQARAVMISMAEKENGRVSESSRVLWYGTGFLTANGRYVVTNYHVAGREVVREFDSFNSSRFDLLALGHDGPIDLAFRQSDGWFQDLTVIPTRGNVSAGFSDARRFDSLRAGEGLHTLGNPHGRSWTYSSGNVALLLDKRSHDPQMRAALAVVEEMLQSSGGRYRRHNYNRLIFAGPGFARPGNSGGAVVDDNGLLVGIVFAVVYLNDGSENTMIIPAEYITRISSGIALTFSAWTTERREKKKSSREEDSQPEAPSDDDSDLPPNRTHYLLRHRPLRDVEVSRLRLILERESPDSAKFVDNVLQRTIFIPIHHTAMMDTRAVRFPDGESRDLVLWHEGKHPQETAPQSPAWFFTSVDGQRRVFITLPADIPLAGEFAVLYEDESEIHVWPE